MALPFGSKNVRYAYWLLLAFVKKNVQSIIVSFLLSLIGIIIVVSFSPIILKSFTSTREIVGMSGKYTVKTLPIEVQSKFSNGLLYINDSGELIPLLADSWEPIDGGTGYLFHIKKDLTWNDGKAFTARDIKYTFKDVAVKAESDYLLAFKLKKPLAIFPHFLTRPIVKYPLIGVAGLYRVDKIKSEAGFISELQLLPNKEGLPIITYKFYDTDTKLVQAYKLGEVTQMTTGNSTVAQAFKSWNNTLVEQVVDYSHVVTLFFNLNDQLFNDNKDIRHAIAQALDKKELEKYGEPAHGPLPPTSWASEPDVKDFPYNPSAATKIVKKYVDASSSAQITISTYYDHLGIADEIKGKLDEVSLKSDVQVLADNLAPDYQILLAPMTLGKDPDQYFFWHSTQTRGNITGYKNVRIDKLLEDGRSNYSLKTRKELYSDFQKILVEDMPAYFLYYPYLYVIKRK